MTENIVVWGAESGRALRVHWMLAEYGLDYVTNPIQARTGETQTDTYRAINPKAKIPTLVHGDLVVSESPAILNYIGAAFPAPEGFLYPSDPATKARHDEWCYFTMTELDAHSLYLVRRHEYLAEVYGAEPGAVKSAWEYFDKQLKAVTPRVGADGPYLLGELFSIPDILFGSCMIWADMYGYSLPESLKAYLARVCERPGFQAGHRVNFPSRYHESAEAVGS